MTVERRLREAILALIRLRDKADHSAPNEYQESARCALVALGVEKNVIEEELTGSESLL